MSNELIVTRFLEALPPEYVDILKDAMKKGVLLPADRDYPLCRGGDCCDPIGTVCKAQGMSMSPHPDYPYWDPIFREVQAKFESATSSAADLIPGRFGSYYRVFVSSIKEEDVNGETIVTMTRDAQDRSTILHKRLAS
jgi:hypothetical protein